MKSFERAQYEWEKLFWKVIRENRDFNDEPMRDHRMNPKVGTGTLKKLEKLETQIRNISEEILLLGGKADKQRECEGRVLVSSTPMLNEIKELKEDIIGVIGFIKWSNSRIRHFKGVEEAIPRFMAEIILAGFVLHEGSIEGRKKMCEFFNPTGIFESKYLEIFNPIYESTVGMRRANINPKIKTIWKSLERQIATLEYDKDNARYGTLPIEKLEDAAIWGKRIKIKLERNICFFTNADPKSEKLNEQQITEWELSENKIKGYVEALKKIINGN